MSDELWCKQGFYVQIMTCECSAHSLLKMEAETRFAFSYFSRLIKDHHAVHEKECLCIVSVLNLHKFSCVCGWVCEVVEKGSICVYVKVSAMPFSV